MFSPSTTTVANGSGRVDPCFARPLAPATDGGEDGLRSSEGLHTIK